MAIVTFWSNGKKETGKTLSMAAIATHIAIEHNYKILVISTIRKDDTLETCYWEPNNNSLVNEITGGKTGISSGIDGLVSLATCNKLTPESISNYTRLVFPNNRLEILAGSTGEDEEEYRKVRETYKDVIQIANNFYDYVFVDLNKGLKKSYIREILEMSDLVVVNIAQGLKAINEIKNSNEENELLKKDNTVLLIGKYDKYSKYNAKNIARNLGYKKQIHVIPYCTLFFEACNEGKIVDFFLKSRTLSHTDKNTIFIKEISEVSSEIVETIKFLKNIY